VFIDKIKIPNFARNLRFGTNKRDPKFITS
jgi:hypothetical protein